MFYLDDAIFHKNTFVGILAQCQETLDRLWEVVRRAYESMPNNLRPRLRKDNAKTLAFEGSDSRLTVSLRILSTTIHRLHVSEYPLCDPEEVGHTLAACPPTAHITLEGVAYGMNHAYNKWIEVKQAGSGWTHTFHPWFLQAEYKEEVPPGFSAVDRTAEESRLCSEAQRCYGIALSDAQILHRRRMRNELKLQFPELYAEDDVSCFLQSGGMFFNGRKIQRLMTEAREYHKQHPPILKTEDFVQWEKPEEGCLYAAGADVAEGGPNGDYSVLAILNVTKQRQAFRYRARVGYDQFYRECDKWGRLYNRALLAPERNNHGHAVILGLRERCHYPNLYADHKARLLAPLGGGVKTVTYGWETTAETRLLMLDQLRSALEGKFEDDDNHFNPEFAVKDVDFLSECLTFRQSSGNKYEAAPGEHDDTIFAWAIAYQMYLRLKGRESRDNFGIFVGGPRET